MDKMASRWTLQQASHRACLFRQSSLPSNYIANIHETVENQVEDNRGTTFVDDVTWVVEGTGTDIDDVISKLELCAAANLQWADDNAVRFETSKTEATLFPRRKRHRQCTWGARVGDRATQSAGEVTRWLGTWLD